MKVNFETFHPSSAKNFGLRILYASPEYAAVYKIVCLRKWLLKIKGNIGCNHNNGRRLIFY